MNVLFKGMTVEEVSKNVIANAKILSEVIPNRSINYKDNHVDGKYRRMKYKHRRTSWI